jgi:hypothetical protein
MSCENERCGNVHLGPGLCDSCKAAETLAALVACVQRALARENDAQDPEGGEDPSAREFRYQCRAALLAAGIACDGLTPDAGAAPIMHASVIAARRALESAAKNRD